MNESTEANSAASDGTTKNFHHVWFLVGFFSFDAVVSIVLLLPWFPLIPQVEGAMSDHYTLWGSLFDLALMAGLRILSGIASLVVSYELAHVRPEFHFDLHHPNGEKKTREELELEALEEPFWPEWFKRYVSRPAFSCEVISFLTQIFAMMTNQHKNEGDIEVRM